ncbi:hypothetical protein BJV82DRAFT_591686 [Fennellomyces sp. T-0311]|nr:hypothetical protein BJV82DRAFT_591686 [Fennellomyces sp. T-0311]
MLFLGVTIDQLIKYSGVCKGQEIFLHLRENKKEIRDAFFLSVFLAYRRKRDARVSFFLVRSIARYLLFSLLTVRSFFFRLSIHLVSVAGFLYILSLCGGFLLDVHRYVFSSLSM